MLTHFLVNVLLGAILVKNVIKRIYLVINRWDASSLHLLTIRWRKFHSFIVYKRYALMSSISRK